MREVNFCRRDTNPQDPACQPAPVPATSTVRKARPGSFTPPPGAVGIIVETLDRGCTVRRASRMRQRPPRMLSDPGRSHPEVRAVVEGRAFSHPLSQQGLQIGFLDSRKTPSLKHHGLLRIEAHVIRGPNRRPRPRRLRRHGERPVRTCCGLSVRAITQLQAHPLASSRLSATRRR